jgi:hypothetical protein
MYATYRIEYENVTHLPGESIDALFQRFTVVLNNMRANVDVLPYDDHDRAVKLLHSLDHTIWGEKFEAIVESEKYDTLTVNELFSKLKSAEVDRGITAKLEGPTDSHSLALIGGSKGKANTNPSTRMFSLSSLMSMPDEECWWRSGPKGGRRHNSPLSSFRPIAYYYEATSTTRAREGNAETLNCTGNETRKYSAERRPKEKRLPSVLSSHYSVSVSLQGVHYL